MPTLLEESKELRTSAFGIASRDVYTNRVLQSQPDQRLAAYQAACSLSRAFKENATLKRRNLCDKRERKPGTEFAAAWPLVYQFAGLPISSKGHQ